MYVCSFYLLTANAHKAANTNISCCYFNGTRNKNCEHSQVNHTVFFQNEINKVANGTYFCDMKSKHPPLLILIVFLFLFRLCYHVHVEVWCPPQTWKVFGTTTWKKTYVFVVCRFLCVSFVDQVDPIYHCYMIGVLYVCGFWSMSVSNWSNTVVNYLSNRNDQTPVICCSSYVYVFIYMFFVVWILIPFLCFNSKSGCITPEQNNDANTKNQQHKKYLLK